MCFSFSFSNTGDYTLLQRVLPSYRKKQAHKRVGNTRLVADGYHIYLVNTTP